MSDHDPDADAGPYGDIMRDTYRSIRRDDAHQLGAVPSSDEVLDEELDQRRAADARSEWVWECPFCRRERTDVLEPAGPGASKRPECTGQTAANGWRAPCCGTDFAPAAIPRRIFAEPDE